jgi:Fe-S cluster assembly protein SufD
MGADIMPLETAIEYPFTDEGFEAFLSNRREPVWLEQLRRDAWRQFGQMSWPSPRSEEWMRTDIRLFHLDQFSLRQEALPAAPAAKLAEGVELSGRAVSINSVSTRCELDPSLAARGVLFGPLEQICREHGDLIRPSLMSRAFDAGYDRFAALHAAFWSSGHVLYVPRGVAIERPLHLQNVLGDRAAELSHTLVVLEDGGSATLLSEMNSATPDATGFFSGGIELLLGRGASLRFVSFQDWSQGVWYFAHQKAIVGSDASLQWTLGGLGSRLAKVNQHVELAGPGATSHVNGVMFAQNKQHLSYHTLQHHRAPSCTSDFLYKAALQDQARTVWRGMIKVDPGAQKTDGYQRNDNLMLSRNCRADSIPGLEIQADDVRCTHGSTSGRVDEELIFYARSRGLTRKEATRLIVSGFFQQVFDRITIESVREALGRAIASRVREYR